MNHEICFCEVEKATDGVSSRIAASGDTTALTDGSIRHAMSQMSRLSE